MCAAAVAKISQAQLIDELVDANHILFNQGVVDGFGHVSVRHPTAADRFLLSRSMAPALVRPTDILLFDFDGNLAVPNDQPAYVERFIHSEIYRARPDVVAVVHSHSASVIPFGVVRDVRLRPLSHMCGFLGDGVGVFDIRDAAGDGSDLLVRNRSLGAALAQSLGNAAAVLMRGHGVTIVGTSLRQAVFRAVYTEVGARLQTEALRLGSIQFLTLSEAEATVRSNDSHIDRAWDLWRMQARSLIHEPASL